MMSTIIKIDEKRLDKLLDAFGHNCDYLFQEVFRKYCCHGIINNELLEESNRNNSEPVEKRMTLAEANKLGLLKNNYEKEEKNNVKE